MDLRTRERGTPEQELALAVVLRAIEDLHDEDELVRFEAHEFFLQPRGEYAEMRHFYFTLLGLDDEWLHEHLSARLTPPERPARKWHPAELYAILPRDRAFTTDGLAQVTGLMPTQVMTRLATLRQKKLVKMPRKSVWVVAEYEPTWRHLEAVSIEAEERRQQREAKPPREKYMTHMEMLDLMPTDREFTSREIQERTGMPTEKVLSRFQDLRMKGLIEHVGHCRWVVVQPQTALKTGT